MTITDISGGYRKKIDLSAANISRAHGRVPAVLMEGAGGAASEAVSTINALRV